MKFAVTVKSPGAVTVCGGFGKIAGKMNCLVSWNTKVWLAAGRVNEPFAASVCAPAFMVTSLVTLNDLRYSIDPRRKDCFDQKC